MLMVGFHIVAIFSSMVWPSLFSYYATFVTNRIASVGYAAYDSNWFEYPLELQKYFVLIIARSKQSSYFMGFGLIQCTLEVFGQVRFLLEYLYM